MSSNEEKMAGPIQMNPAADRSAPPGEESTADQIQQTLMTERLGAAAPVEPEGAPRAPEMSAEPATAPSNSASFQSSASHPSQGASDAAPLKLSEQQKAAIDRGFKALDEMDARAAEQGTPKAVKKAKQRLSFLQRVVQSQPKPVLASELAFFLTGFVMAVWASMVPFVKRSLELNEGQMGLLLLCVGLGALIGMPAAGILTSRFGARLVLRWSVPIVMAFCIMLSASSQTFVTAAFLLCFGFAYGVVDVAMSVHSVFVEKRMDRPVLSVIYAFYPIGGIAGALAMSLLLNIGLPIEPCVLALMTLSQLSWLACGNWIIPTAGRAAGSASHFALPRGRVLLFGAVVFIAYLADGSILDWGGLLLTNFQGWAIENAGFGYGCFSVAMMIMRLFGAKAVSSLGPRRTVIWGALLGAAAIVAAVIIENPLVTLSMFFLVGLGISCITPLTFAEAGRTQSMSMSAALSAVSTLGYSGVLVGPAMIGGIAHATNLPSAFYFTASLLLLTAVLGLFYPKSEPSLEKKADA